MAKVPGLVRQFKGTGKVGPDGKALMGTPFLNGYQWNLPPHQWSMPVEPSKVDPIVVDTAKYMVGSSHKWRRGRVYWFAQTDNAYLGSNKYNNGTDKSDPRYGFQFLWNPDQFSTQVQMNMGITPSFADKFVDVAGAFPSGEVLTVVVKLDRTNDFAAIKSMKPGSKLTYDQLAKQYAAEPFYNSNNSHDSEFASTFVSKLQELQKLGTIADVEYLYKAINGPGWVNRATGRASSDIGFLSPTLLRIDIGPLSYLGYVSSMNVTHTNFSKGMIPITTDVSLQFNIMATAGLATK